MKKEKYSLNHMFGGNPLKGLPKLKKGDPDVEDGIAKNKALNNKIENKGANEKQLTSALKRRKSGSVRYLGGEKPKHEDDYPWD